MLLPNGITDPLYFTAIPKMNVSLGQNVFHATKRTAIYCRDECQSIFGRIGVEAGWKVVFHVFCWNLTWFMRSELVHDGDTFWIEFIKLCAFVDREMVCANARRRQRIASGGRKTVRQVGMMSSLAHIESYIVLVFLVANSCHDVN